MLVLWLVGALWDTGLYIKYSSLRFYFLKCSSLEALLSKSLQCQHKLLLCMNHTFWCLWCLWWYDTNNRISGLLHKMKTCSQWDFPVRQMLNKISKNKKVHTTNLLCWSFLSALYFGFCVSQWLPPTVLCMRLLPCPMAGIGFKMYPFRQSTVVNAAVSHKHLFSKWNISNGGT